MNKVLIISFVLMAVSSCVKRVNNEGFTAFYDDLCMEDKESIIVYKKDLLFGYIKKSDLINEAVMYRYSDESVITNFNGYFIVQSKQTKSLLDSFQRANLKGVSFEELPKKKIVGYPCEGIRVRYLDRLNNLVIEDLYYLRYQNTLPLEIVNYNFRNYTGLPVESLIYSDSNIVEHYRLRKISKYRNGYFNIPNEGLLDTVKMSDFGM